jgi:uncharacterized membrane protein YkvI
MSHDSHDDHDGVPHLPPPTPWPMVMGIAITLMMAGLVVFLRGEKALVELAFPILGVVLFFLSLIMMLRDDIKAFEEGGGHH